MLKRLLSVFMAFLVMYGCIIISFAETRKETTEFILSDTDNPFSAILPKETSITERSEGEDILVTEGSHTTDKSADIPASYDSRSTGCITPVKNQGQTGTCWAYATVACLEAYDIKHGFKTAEEADYSETHLVWYAGNTVDSGGEKSLDGTNIGENAYYIGGHYIIASNTLSEMSGINNEADYPQMSEISTDFDDTVDRYARTSGRILNESIVLSDTDAIKQWIMDNGAVSVGYCSDADSYMYRNSDMDYSYYTGDMTTDDVNHNVTIVGWDDNWSADNFKPGNKPSGDGAWLIKDSWGNVFDHGYYWISYYEPSLGNFVGYTTKSAEDYLNNYSYCSSYFVTYLNSVTNYGTYKTISEANVFTAENNEYIDAVNFWTIQEDLTAKISIYTGLPATYTSPASGTLAETFTVTVNEIGCHTFSLPNSVRVDSGTRFSVCVQLTSATSSVLIPVENNNAVPCVAHQKESYYKLGSNWYDITSNNYGNFYVKVQTKCEHNYVHNVVESGCLTNGYDRVICSQCGKVTGETVLPAKDHEFEYVSTVNPTCTEFGAVKYACKNCTETYSVPLPATGHSYGISSRTYDPYSHTAVILHSCQKCEHSYTEIRYEYKQLVTLAELLLAIKTALSDYFSRII